MSDKILNILQAGSKETILKIDFINTFLKTLPEVWSQINSSIIKNLEMYIEEMRHSNENIELFTSLLNIISRIHHYHGRIEKAAFYALLGYNAKNPEKGSFNHKENSLYAKEVSAAIYDYYITRTSMREVVGDIKNHYLNDEPDDNDKRLSSTLIAKNCEDFITTASFSNSSDARLCFLLQSGSFLNKENRTEVQQLLISQAMVFAVSELNTKFNKIYPKESNKTNENENEETIDFITMKMSTINEAIINGYSKSLDKIRRDIQTLPKEYNSLQKTLLAFIAKQYIKIHKFEEAVRTILFTRDINKIKCLYIYILNLYLIENYPHNQENDKCVVNKQNELEEDDCKLTEFDSKFITNLVSTSGAVKTAFIKKIQKDYPEAPEIVTEDDYEMGLAKPIESIGIFYDTSILFANISIMIYNLLPNSLKEMLYEEIQHEFNLTMEKDGRLDEEKTDISVFNKLIGNILSGEEIAPLEHNFLNISQHLDKTLVRKLQNCNMVSTDMSMRLACFMFMSFVKASTGILLFSFRNTIHSINSQELEREKRNKEYNKFERWERFMVSSYDGLIARNIKFIDRELLADQRKFLAESKSKLKQTTNINSLIDTKDKEHDDAVLTSTDRIQMNIREYLYRNELPINLPDGSSLQAEAIFRYCVSIMNERNNNNKESKNAYGTMGMLGMGGMKSHTTEITQKNVYKDPFIIGGSLLGLAFATCGQYIKCDGEMTPISTYIEYLGLANELLELKAAENSDDMSKLESYEPIVMGAAFGLGLSTIGSGSIGNAGELLSIMKHEQCTDPDAIYSLLISIGLIFFGNEKMNKELVRIININSLKDETKLSMNIENDENDEEEDFELTFIRECIQIIIEKFDSVHERVRRAASVALALICYGLKEQSDPVANYLLGFENSDIRRGGAIALGLAYANTGNLTVTSRLLQIASSDSVNQDLCRTAVACSAFILTSLKDKKQGVKLLTMISRSHNIHARAGAAIALGYLMAGTHDQLTVETVRLMIADQSEAVRSSAYIAMALILQNCPAKELPFIDKSLKKSFIIKKTIASTTDNKANMNKREQEREKEKQHKEKIQMLKEKENNSEEDSDIEKEKEADKITETLAKKLNVSVDEVKLTSSNITNLRQVKNKTHRSALMSLYSIPGNIKERHSQFTKAAAILPPELMPTMEQYCEQFRNDLIAIVTEKGHKEKTVLGSRSAVIALGILNASGQNGSFSLTSTGCDESGNDFTFINDMALVGALLFDESWYWHPLTPALMLGQTTNAFIPAVINEEKCDRLEPCSQLMCCDAKKYIPYSDYMKEKMPESDTKSKKAIQKTKTSLNYLKQVNAMKKEQKILGSSKSSACLTQKQVIGAENITEENENDVHNDPITNVEDNIFENSQLDKKTKTVDRLKKLNNKSKVDYNIISNDSNTSSSEEDLNIEEMDGQYFNYLNKSYKYVTDKFVEMANQQAKNKVEIKKISVKENINIMDDFADEKEYYLQPPFRMLPSEVSGVFLPKNDCEHIPTNKIHIGVNIMKPYLDMDEPNTF